MSKHVVDQISYFLEGELSPRSHMYFLDHITNCASCKQEYETHISLLEAFKEELSEVPSAELANGFEGIIGKENAAQISIDKNIKALFPFFWNIRKYVAVFLVAIISYLLGNGSSSIQNAKMISMEAQQSELMEMLTISMLNAESASKRIKASSFLKGINNPSDEVIDALIARMRNDKHINVRLAALSALSEYTALEEVKFAMLEILESEKDPNMIIEVIELFTKSSELEVIPELHNLLMKQDLPILLRQEIQETINEII